MKQTEAGQSPVAKAAIMASGRGTNFEVLTGRLRESGHEVSALICDRKKAGAFDIARRRKVPAYHVSYWKRDKSEAEAEISTLLKSLEIDLVLLAGFMRVLSPSLVQEWEGRIVNIHPSLLPRHPGTDAISRSYYSGDSEMGITIHLVDQGVDTGPVLLQKSFPLSPAVSLEEAEKKIHELEHRWYPEIAISLLNQYDKRSGGTP